MSWKLTDDSCMQYVKRLESDYFYELIEMCLIDSDDIYEVYTDKINVRFYIEHSFAELLSILHTFGYESLNALYDEYRNSYARNQIIAELIFEYYGSLQANVLFTGTESECINFIKKYVDETNEMWYRADYDSDTESEYFTAEDDVEALEYAEELNEVEYSDIGIVKRNLQGLYEVDDNTEFFDELREVYF